MTSLDSQNSIPNFKSLGAVVDEFRIAKKMTIKDLCAIVNMSDISYRNWVKGERDISVTHLFSLFTFLRIGFIDLHDWLAANHLINIHRKNQLDKIYTEILKGQAQLTTLQSDVDQLSIRHDGIAIIKYGQLLIAKLNRNSTIIKQAATTLINSLSSYQAWTSYEYQLALPTYPYLDFDQVNQIHHHYFNFTKSTFVIADALVIDSYLTFLTVAIQKQDVTAITKVITWIEATGKQSPIHEWSIMMKFAHCIRKYVMHDQIAAQHSFEHLNHQLSLFQGPHSTLKLSLQQIWQQLTKLTNIRSTKIPRPKKGIDYQNGAETSLTSASNQLTTLTIAKGLTSARLIQLLDISPSTYYRVISEDALLKAAQFLQIAKLLKLTPYELQMIYERTTPNPIAQQRALINELPQIQQSPLRRELLHAKLIELRFKQPIWNEGYNQIAITLEVVLSGYENTKSDQQTNVVQLYQHLIDYEYWSAFENSLIITIVPYLPFTYVQALFNRFLTSSQHQVQTLPTITPMETDQLFINILLCAANGQDLADVRTACQWLIRRQLNHNNSNFYIIQRIAMTILDQTHHVATAADEFAQLTALLDELDVQQHQKQSTFFKQLFKQIQRIPPLEA